MDGLKDQDIKNMLRMMYNGKFKKITSKLIYLPDDKFFNTETGSFIDLNINETKWRKDVQGYQDADFLYIGISSGDTVYNNDATVQIMHRSHRGEKPKVHKISQCEWLITYKENNGHKAVVYNDAVKAVTKRMNCFNMLRDSDSIILTYMENNNLMKINLKIL